MVDDQDEVDEFEYEFEEEFEDVFLVALGSYVVLWLALREDSS